MKKMDAIFQFLKENHRWNHVFQTQVDASRLAGIHGNRDQLIRLLHAVSETQSAPNLDKLAEFWQRVHGLPRSAFKDLGSFVAALSSDRREGGQDIWQALFLVMCDQKGWGTKTSALLVKDLIRIARSRRGDDDFWASCPTDARSLKKADLFIPVDAVILKIFAVINNNAKCDFWSVNTQLKNAGYKGSDFLLWDDLWFWGFVTQKGGAERETAWNAPKYWCLWGTPKDERSVALAQEQAEEFLSILLAR